MRRYHKLNIKKVLALIVSHGSVLAAGFALGIYMLPIITAPPSPDPGELAGTLEQALFKGHFSKDREDSDALHWVEGTISIAKEQIVFEGQLSPGPDYWLYLSPEFIETEEAFNRLKPDMKRIAPVKTFDNFLVQIPEGIKPSEYRAVIIWCETFGQFISSAQYQ